MAKHFKEAPPQSTEVMSARGVRRAQGRVSTGSGTGHLPYGQVASYRASYSDAAPTDEYFLDDMPARGGLPAVVRAFLLLLAWALRLVAFAATALVVANVLSLSIMQSQLTWATDFVTQYLPWRMMGLLEVDTPFGGVFRGDLSIVALALFVADWLMCRLRASLR